MSPVPVTEFELHAYVDGALSDAQRAEVEAYLASHSEDAERVAAYRLQNEALRTQFGPIAEEAVPERLRKEQMRRAKSWLPFAAAAGWMTLGGVIGWQLQAYHSEQRMESSAWARRAAIAHVVYSPEVRHPVEVGADQETHLVNWLSKRLGTKVHAPRLDEVGMSLVGGRLLPGDSGPVAQFMYQTPAGRRITLYVRAEARGQKETAFRYARESNVGVFYWVDRNCGYALASADLSKDELLRIATMVYKQIE